MRKSRMIIIFSLFFAIMVPQCDALSPKEIAAKVAEIAKSISDKLTTAKSFISQFPSKLAARFSSSTVKVAGSDVNSFENLDQIKLIAPLSIKGKNVPLGLIIPLGEKGIGDPNTGFSQVTMVGTSPKLWQIVPNGQSLTGVFPWLNLSFLDLLMKNVTDYKNMPSQIKDPINQVASALAPVSSKLKPFFNINGRNLFLIKCSLAAAAYRSNPEKLSLTLTALLGKLLKTRKPDGSYYTLNDVFIGIPGLLSPVVDKFKATLNTAMSYWNAPAPGQTGFRLPASLDKTKTAQELLKLLIWTYRNTNNYAKKLNKTARWVFDNHSIIINDQSVKIKDIAAGWLVMIMSKSSASASTFEALNNLFKELLGMDLMALTMYAERNDIEPDFFSDFGEEVWEEEIWEEW